MQSTNSQSERKDRKRKFYRKQHFKNSAIDSQDGSKKTKRFGRRRGIEPGDQGFLVTCQNGQESRAEKEVLDLLNDYLTSDKKLIKIETSADKSSTAATETESIDNVDDDLEKALRNECVDLKKSVSGENTPNSHGFSLEPVDAGVKNNCFIKLTSPGCCETPSSIVYKILRDMRSKGEQRGRYGHRLMPVDVTFKPYDKEFFEACKTCLETYFARSTQDNDAKSTASSPTTYAVHFKQKNNSGSNLTKEIVCDYVVECLVHFKVDFKIDLNRPDVTIVVEVLGKIGFISIAKGYYELSKYNLQKIASVEEQNLSTKEDQILSH